MPSSDLAIFGINDLGPLALIVIHTVVELGEGEGARIVRAAKGGARDRFPLGLVDYRNYVLRWYFIAILDFMSYLGLRASMEVRTCRSFAAHFTHWKVSGRGL